MNVKHFRWFGYPLGMVAIGLALCSLPLCARANVYATNIKLNGSLTNSTAAPGTPVTISYILNEPATLGVTVHILSSTGVVRTLTIPGDYIGTFPGVNAIEWDGQDAASNNVPPGTYSVSITTATSGYTNWNQITSDSATAVWLGRGIAVDGNTNSPYYGRVFVCNSQEHNLNLLGILKFNADASPADEGGFSAGGRTWVEGSPAKVVVAPDDYVYVDDPSAGGGVFRWDPTINDASQLYVLRADNQPLGAQLAGPAIALNGTNTEIWMADYVGNSGIAKWVLGPDGTCVSNDLGKTVVGLGTGTNLTVAPVDVALDKSGNIYTCSFVRDSGASAQRVFRFPAYDPSTNAGAAEVTADWAVGGGDDTYAYASGVAIDPTGTYVAASFEGIGFPPNGNTKVLYATNGALVANLDLGVPMGPPGNQDTTHSDTACAWDAVGNVYYIDNWWSAWRAVSPPGTNQSTTVAFAKLEVAVPAPPAPVITSIQTSGGNVIINFTAGTNDVASGFNVLGAVFVIGPYTAVTTATITRVSPGVFQAVFPNNGTMQFYRIARVTAPPQRPVLTGIGASGANVVLTFTGSTNDVASAFSVSSAATVNGTFSPATSQSIIALSPGVFQATVPKNGPSQFYRIGR